LHGSPRPTLEPDLIAALEQPDADFADNTLLVVAALSFRPSVIEARCAPRSVGSRERSALSANLIGQRFRQLS
jgi:hypothetical protein